VGEEGVGMGLGGQVGRWDVGSCIRVCAWFEVAVGFRSGGGWVRGGRGGGY